MSPVDTILAELARVGIEPTSIVRNKHVKVRWLLNGQPRVAGGQFNSLRLEKH